MARADTKPSEALRLVRAALNARLLENQHFFISFKSSLWQRVNQRKPTGSLRAAPPTHPGQVEEDGGLCPGWGQKGPAGGAGKMSTCRPPVGLRPKFRLRTPQHWATPASSPQRWNPVSTRPEGRRGADASLSV